MAGPARYSELGPELQRESPGSTQISFAPNPFARLFARLINAVIWVGAGLLLLLANLVIIGGIAIGETWPLLNDLLIADVPSTDRLIVEVLAESFADYRVRDVALIALIPIATIPLWFILRMVYLCLLVRFAGGDLGHLVMGMRVVSYRNGCRPSFGQALSRAILKQLDLLVMPFLLNCALVLFNRDRRHTYDFAANTIVVSAGWTLLPFLEHKPTVSVITGSQLSDGAAIPLPPPTIN